MRTGQYDGVSASGNASARLVEGGDVDPVNVDLVPNYETIFADLKDQPYNTFDGVHYGIPHGRGANLLMWNTNDVKPAPTSWDVILDPKKAAKYKGRISAYDDPIYIADAAVYLKAHQPDLGIDNPYELNDEQFDAAVDLLKEQRPNVGEYWSEAAKQISAFANGDSTVGTTWQYQYFELQGAGEPVEASPASQGFLPSEGATGWSDTWMLSSQAKHPNCMYNGWTGSSRRKPTPRWPNTSARRRHRALPATRPQTKTSAPSTTPITPASGNGSTTGRRRSPTAATGRATARTTTTGSRRGPRSRAEPVAPIDG